MFKKLLHTPFFIRLFSWEYWPFHVIYGPIYFYWIWLCIRSRSFFFMNTANPSITNGGFLMESKHEVYKLIPSEYFPSTLFFGKNTPPSEVTMAAGNAGLKFPMIGKPDIGMKGLSVKKLENENELVEYARVTKVDFLLQEFISLPNEVGIFYYRYPGETKGKISGMVLKDFPSVTGNGSSTLKQLIWSDKRFILQWKELTRLYGDKMGMVLKDGYRLVLMPYGNHARGSKFIDISHLVDDRIQSAINKVCSRIEGFYYGRLDIRFQSWQDLKNGEKFSIIELNGAGSEPTHIYDPKHSILFAWKEIIRHWIILWRISKMNYHKVERPFMNTRSGINMLRENRRYLKRLVS